MSNTVAAYILVFTSAAGGGNPPAAPELEAQVETAITQSVGKNEDARIETTSTATKPAIGLITAFSKADMAQISAAITAATKCTQTGVVPGTLQKQRQPNGILAMSMSPTTYTYTCAAK